MHDLGLAPEAGKVVPHVAVVLLDGEGDPAPDVPSLIRRVLPPYALAWGGLQRLLG